MRIVDPWSHKIITIILPEDDIEDIFGKKDIKIVDLHSSRDDEQIEKLGQYMCKDYQ